MPAADGAAYTLFQLFEGWALDCVFVASQFHDLACFDRHFVYIVQFLAWRVNEQVLDDDAEAEYISGTSWLEQMPVLLKLWCQVSERPGNGTAVLLCFATKEMEYAFLASGQRLVALRSTYDVVHCRVFPVNDLDGPTRVHVTLVNRQVPVNQVLSMKIRLSLIHI